jgi:hypothetical protein
MEGREVWARSSGGVARARSKEGQMAGGRRYIARALRIFTALATALCVAPATAAAATEWFYNRQPIPAGQVVEVPTSAPKTTVSVLGANRTKFQAVCSVSGVDAFSNTEAGGRDETRELAFACPAGTTVTPLLLPWSSTLVEGIPPLHDEWEGVSLEVSFGGTNHGVFSGVINTVVGDVDPQHERETKPEDEADNFMTFRGGPQSAFLLGPGGAKLWLAGKYHLGTKTAFITDESGAF